MFIPDTEQPKSITEPIAGGSFIPDAPLPTAGVGGTLAEFGKGVVRGAMNVGAGITGTLGTFAAAKTTPFRGFAPGETTLALAKAPPPKERAEPFFEAKKKIKAAEEAYPVTHQGAGAWAGRVLGEAIPYMGAALAGGYVLGPIGAAMVGFAVEGDAAYDEAIARGASEGEAQTERVIVGSINAAIETLQITQLMKFHKAGGGTLKNFVKLARAKAWKLAGGQLKNFGANTLKTAVTEAAEEFLQEGVSISVPAVLRDDYPRLPDGSPDLWAIGRRLGEAALGGGFAGAVLGAGGAAITTTPYLAKPTDVEITNAIKRTQESGLSQAEKDKMIGDFEALRLEPGAEPVVTAPEAAPTGIAPGVGLKTISGVDAAFWEKLGLATKGGLDPVYGERTKDRRDVIYALARIADFNNKDFSEQLKYYTEAMYRADALQEAWSRPVYDQEALEFAREQQKEINKGIVTAFGSREAFLKKARQVSQLEDQLKPAPPGVVTAPETIPLYHGSPQAGLTEIKPSRGDYGNGIQVSLTKELADYYSQGRKNVAAYVLGETETVPTKGTTYGVKVTPKNPLIIQNADEFTRYENLAIDAGYEGGDRAGIGKWAQKQGYDAVFDYNSNEGVIFTDKAVPTTALAAVAAPTADLLAKLKAAIEEVEILRPGEEAEISAERGKRFGEWENLIVAESNPRIAYLMANKALAGRLKIKISSLENRFSEEEISSLYEQVRSTTMLAGTKKNAFDGLEGLMYEGRIPAKHEIEAMEEAFGVDIARALIEKRRQAGKDGWDKVIDAINIPRALLASYDLSASGRQGILLLPLVPKEWLKAVGRGYRAFANPEYAKFIDLQIKTNPYYEKLSKSGLDLTRVGGITSGEEVFISDFAGKIPGVTASERAYVTTLNSLRAGTFYHFAEQWEGSGRTAKDYKSLAAFINHATGRGNVKALKKYYPVLNAAFFAPRLHMGRVQVLADLFTTTSAVRKLVVADLLEFVGGGLLVLTLLNLLRGVDVEPDPRSTDFGKIRIGNTRIDFWSGYSQIARFVVQFALAERKATETGHIMPVERGDVIWRFIQSKLSPPAGFAVDMIRGETYLGKRLELEPEVMSREAFERFVPLFIQDLTDAIRFQGLDGASLVAPLALHGIGAMTYPVRASSEATRLKDTYAQKYFGQRWDDIGPKAQTLLKEHNPQINLKEEEARMEREDFDFMAKIAEEQNKSAKKVRGGLSRDVQKELDNLTVRVEGLSRHIASNWYLNDKRYKQYQDNTTKILDTVLPKVIRSPMWNKLDFDKKREILKGLIDGAKKAAREKIVQAANINDIEQLWGKKK